MDIQIMRKDAKHIGGFKKKCVHGWSGINTSMTSFRHSQTSPANLLSGWNSQPSIRLIMKPLIFHIQWCNNSRSWKTSKASFQSSFIHALNESENSWRFFSRHEWEFHKIKNLFAFCFPFNHLQNGFRARADAWELRWEPVNGWIAGICLKLMSHGWWGRLTMVKYLLKPGRWRKRQQKAINV